MRFSDAPPKVVLVQRRTRDEARALFYRKKEFASFRGEVHETVQALRANGLEGIESEVCLQALARFLNDPQERKRKYVATIQVVLDEEKRQKSLGTKDPEAIRIVSSMCSRWDRRRAYELATVDNDAALLRLITGQNVIQSNASPRTKTSATLRRVQPKRVGSRRVRFGHTPSETFHKDKREPHEVKATWYTSHDMASFRQENNSTLERWRQGFSFADSETHCFRGLERFTLESKMSRKAVILVVLDEQKHQRARGLNIPSAIKKISQLCSRGEHQRALEFAALDCAFAASFHESQDQKRKRIVAACRRIMVKGFPTRGCSLLSL